MINNKYMLQNFFSYFKNSLDKSHRTIIKQIYYDEYIMKHEQKLYKY